MSHIFVSYSRQNLWAMRCVATHLRGERLKVWVDETLTPGTEGWQSAIETAIKGAACVVAILSPEAASSTWVQNELGYAEMQKIRIFPVLASGDPREVIPIQLVSRQWIDIRSDYDTSLCRLVAAIKELPGAVEPEEQENDKHLGWPKFHAALLELQEKINASPQVHSALQEGGGFRPHLVIGINHGGAVLGGLLYDVCNGTFQFTTLWMYDDLKVHQRAEQKDALTRLLTRYSYMVNGPIRVLLVDDSFKSGSAMAKARALVGEVGENLKANEVEMEVKTAVMVYRDDLHDERKGPPPDYYVFRSVTHFPYGRV